ncbi:uncharacterized protein [Panulirus ornatus]|uniref:uncharacterized protein n=1 Tax=Panulirus ornatus TaxID=150431 RepID=UPI003A846A2D
MLPVLLSGSSPTKNNSVMVTEKQSWSVAVHGVESMRLLGSHRGEEIWWWWWPDIPYLCRTDVEVGWVGTYCRVEITSAAAPEGETFGLVVLVTLKSPSRCVSPLHPATDLRLKTSCGKVDEQWQAKVNQTESRSACLVWWPMLGLTSSLA